MKERGSEGGREVIREKGKMKRNMIRIEECMVL